MSLTQAELDQYGVTKITGDARNRGYVNFDGRQITDVAGFYNKGSPVVLVLQNITCMMLPTSVYVNLSLGYSLPKKWF